MFIPKEKILYIQEQVSIEDVIYSTGYKVVGTGRSKGINICPNCNRDYTHIKLNTNKNLFNCYSKSCNFKGNQFHWVMKTEGLSFVDAVKRVAEIGGIELELDQKAKEFEIKRQKAFNLTLDFYRNYDNDYLNNRGINNNTKEIFKVGYAPGGVLLKKHLNEHKYSNEFLLKIGLIRKVNNKLLDRFYQSVIIPDIRDNKIYDFYARSINPKIKNKHQYLYGKNSRIGSHTIKYNGDIYIAEAPIDALSLYQIYNKGVFSIGGAGKFNVFHINLIKKKNLKPIFAYDNDKTGKEGIIESIEILKPHDIESKVLTISDKKTKDINLVLQENRLEQLKIKDSDTFVNEYYLSQIPIDTIINYIKTEFPKYKNIF